VKMVIVKSDGTKIPIEDSQWLLWQDGILVLSFPEGKVYLSAGAWSEIRPAYREETFDGEYEWLGEVEEFSEASPATPPVPTVPDTTDTMVDIFKAAWIEADKDPELTRLGRSRFGLQAVIDYINDRFQLQAQRGSKES
jgi:hypothetical protein